MNPKFHPRVIFYKLKFLYRYYILHWYGINTLKWLRMYLFELKYPEVIEVYSWAVHFLETQLKEKI